MEFFFPEDSDGLQKLEFDIEDRIYKMLRTEFIITNNRWELMRIIRSLELNVKLFFLCQLNISVFHSSQSTIRLCKWWSGHKIRSFNWWHWKSHDFYWQSFKQGKANWWLGRYPSNEGKKNVFFECFNRIDRSINISQGFAKPLRLYRGPAKHEKPKQRSIVDLLNVHVNEALRTGFDDSVSKFKGKSHFVVRLVNFVLYWVVSLVLLFQIPNIKTWYETFKIIHKIFIENPENPNFEASDADYKAYLKNFHKIMDVDER